MAGQEPSEEFIEAFRAGIGSIRAECEFCGRECFEDDEHAGDWEDGELEKLRERAQSQPDKCVAMDTVSLGMLDGKRFVMGCPCLADKIRPYENFIWSHRRQIAEYVHKRVKIVVESAIEDEVAAEHLNDNLAEEQRASEKVMCKYCKREVPKVTWDEDEERCAACKDKLVKFGEEASETEDMGRYNHLCKEIEKLGGFPPKFKPDTWDDNLPF